MDEEIKKILDSHEQRIANLEKIQTSTNNDASNTVSKKLSLKEFLLSIKPESHVLKTLSIGYYLEKFGESAAFNTTDLENAFREAKESLPSNINQMVNENIKKGHIMEAKEKKNGLKSWVLTSSGEIFVETNFQKESEH